MVDFSVDNLGCGCNAVGMALCSGWQNCSCKTGYSGATCSECAEGYFMNRKQCTSKHFVIIDLAVMRETEYH